MRIIDSPSTRQPTDKLPARPEATTQRDAWSLVGWLGFAFMLLGFADIALGVYPTAFGNAEWEFGTVSGVLNGFAIPTMGAYLLLGSLIARQSRVAARALAVVMVVVAATLVVLALLYATGIPLALRTVQQNAVLTLGIKKAILKAAMLLVAYLALYVYGAVRGWRAGRPS